jgi:ABC-2 type transport system ATP-binding protein
LDHVSFSVGKGEIVGLLGPNGAGKSTAMNILTGYLSATDGTVTVDGDNILDKPEEVKSKIGYLPEHPPLYLEMTVDEFLRFVCELKSVPKDEMQERIEAGLERVGIADVQHRLIKNLSKGYRQRVGLAQALMGNPEVLILDEPTIGLDPHQIIEIRDLIRSLGEEHTVILSSHILHEVSAVCKRIIIIHDGEILADGTPESLSESLSDQGAIYLRVAGDESQVRNALNGVDGIGKLEFTPADEPDAVGVKVETSGSGDIRKELFYALSEAKLPILHLRTENLTLEDIFLKITMGEKEAV